MRKYRLFGKIPVFDVIIIALILVVGIVCFNIFMSSKSGEIITGTEKKTIRYTVDFFNISGMVDGVPEIGEKVFDSATNFEVGKIVAAETRPYIMYDYNEITGETVTTTYTDRQLIRVVIESKANVSELCTEINSVRIGIGKTITYNMPSLCSAGVVKNIEEVA